MAVPLGRLLLPVTLAPAGLRQRLLEDMLASAWLAKANLVSILPAGFRAGRPGTGEQDGQATHFPRQLSGLASLVLALLLRVEPEEAQFLMGTVHHLAHRIANLVGAQSIGMNSEAMMVPMPAVHKCA